jgi:hypothetical protein
LRPLGLDWEICPRSDGHYGDYLGSVFVPGLRYEQHPWIVTAHTDSTYSTSTPEGCRQVPSSPTYPGQAFDQHIQAVVW